MAVVSLKSSIVISNWYIDSFDLLTRSNFSSPHSSEINSYSNDVTDKPGPLSHALRSQTWMKLAADPFELPQVRLHKL